ncbi:hypothetical protein F4678DRAFT_466445 [Xylaria arbuscula]|nr:hypothetical protein F4678DRAFT_466445 [Xylaria arbuscula]
MQINKGPLKRVWSRLSGLFRHDHQPHHLDQSHQNKQHQPQDAEQIKPSDPSLTTDKTPKNSSPPESHDTDGKKSEISAMPATRDSTIPQASNSMVETPSTHREPDLGVAGHLEDNRDDVISTNRQGEKAEGEAIQEKDNKAEKTAEELQRDLWAEAWNSNEVGENKRSLLEGKLEDNDIERLGKLPGELVNDVAELTREKLAAYSERWGTKAKKTASQLGQSILSSVLTVKDLVEAGLKFDPTGYASSAWMVVCFGLKLVQNDKENMDLTFEACQFLAEIMARYARLEFIYRETKINDSKPLGDAIVKVYISILTYSATVKESLNSSKLHRIKQSFLSLTGQPLSELKRRIAEGNEVVESWEQLIGSEITIGNATRLTDIQEKANKIMDGLERTESGILEVRHGVKDEELREMFQWLFSAGSAGQTKTHNELREAIIQSEGENYKAGGWLLSKTEYCEWKKYPQSLLWLSGTSGCGKSSLCSTIIDNLEDTFDADDTKVLMYWYFRFYLDETKKTDFFLRSLLRQLGSKYKGFPEEVLESLRFHRDSGTPPKNKNLFRWLQTCIQKANKDVFIVLDGLDEFPEDSEGEKRSDLLRYITDLASATHPNLHILLVSKVENDIQDCLKTKLGDILVQVDVNGELNQDLNNFIKIKMDNMKTLDSDLKQQIHARLNEGEGRNFLLAASVLTDVDKCQRKEDIQDTLQKVPRNMVDVYQAALSNVTEANMKSTKSILMWVLRQLRPLSRDEIAAAVGLMDTTLVTHICSKPFVETRIQTVRVACQDQQLDVVRFIHSTAKTYLESVQLSREPQETKIERFVFADDDAHLQMATRCLKVLLDCSERQGSGATEYEETGQTPPLLHYAVEYWFKHYSLIDRAKISKNYLDELDKDVCSLLNSNSIGFMRWVDIYDPGYKNRKTGRPPPVYYAVKLGPPELAEQLIREAEDDDLIEKQWGEGCTTLQLVAHQGHERILDVLLKREVDVNADAGANGTALYAASAMGHMRIVQNLLNAGAKVSGKKDGALGNPLHVAAYNGHVEVIKILLDHGGLKVDHVAGIFGTSLQAASAARKLPAVELLLDHKADPNAVGGRFQTAMQATLGRLHTGTGSTTSEILKRLRLAGARYNDRFEFWAAAYKRASSDHDISPYNSLFKYQGPGWKELVKSQRIIVGAISEWTFPEPTNDHQHLLLKKKLEDILRATPKLEVTLEELSRKDFRYKALFRAGINYIFKSLVSPDINEEAARRLGRLHFPPSLSVHSEPYRSRRGVLSRNSSSDEDCFVDVFPETLGHPWYKFLHFLGGVGGLPYREPVDESDLMALAIMKSREQEKLRENFSNAGKANDSILWLLTDLPCFLRDLIDFENRCTHYHNVAHRNPESISRAMTDVIEDLTFELFSAVIRLATSLPSGDSHWDRSTRVLKLLTDVRLPRISHLDALCREATQSKAKKDRYLEMATELTGQIQVTITERLSNVQDEIMRHLVESPVTLDSEIRTQVHEAVKKGISQVTEQILLELEAKTQQEVQCQLLGGEAGSLQKRTLG